MEKVEELVHFLQAYKAKMEFQNEDFHGGCPTPGPAQQKELPYKMAKLYEDSKKIMKGNIT